MPVEIHLRNERKLCCSERPVWRNELVVRPRVRRDSSTFATQSPSLAADNEHRGAQAGFDRRCCIERRRDSLRIGVADPTCADPKLGRPIGGAWFENGPAGARPAAAHAVDIVFVDSCISECRASGLEAERKNRSLMVSSLLCRRHSRDRDVAGEGHGPEPAGRKTGSIRPPSVSGSHATSTGCPILRSAGSHSTRFVSIDQPSSSSTIARTYGTAKPGAGGRWHTVKL